LWQFQEGAWVSLEAHILQTEQRRVAA
jgi:hypothetical protein